MIASTLFFISSTLMIGVQNIIEYRKVSSAIYSLKSRKLHDEYTTIFNKKAFMGCAVSEL